MTEQPATSAGTTTAAGEGVDDEEFRREVGSQTAPDLAVEGAFERERDGATSDVEAAAQNADDAS